MEVRYKVNEQFDSVQGEGLWTGVPATFIRLQGCSVGCPWCDSGPLADEIEGKRRTNGMTANTWGPGGEWKTAEEILSDVHEKHAIITGGEPTIWNLDKLIVGARVKGCYVQLETSGQNSLKGIAEPDWVTWSPKPNLEYNIPSNLAVMVNEIKFVIDTVITPADIDKVIKSFRAWYLPPIPIVLMPEGCPPSTESIARTMQFLHSEEIDYGAFTPRFGDRLQYRLSMR